MTKFNFVPVSSPRKNREDDPITIKRMAITQMVVENASIEHMLQEGLFDVAEFIKELIEHPQRRPEWPMIKEFSGFSGEEEAVHIELYIQKCPVEEMPKRMH